MTEDERKLLLMVANALTWVGSPAELYAMKLELAQLVVRVQTSDKH